MTAGVTLQQARCLEAIKAYIAEHGCSPTFSEIGAALGMSTHCKGNVHALVHALAERGLISLGPARRSRSIRLIEGPTLEQMLEWPREEQNRVLEDLLAIHRARLSAKAIARADAILAEGRA